MSIAKINGIDMYYERHGSGYPLLMIMGITARGSVWEDHLVYWSQFFECIIVDNRGVGLSSVPDGEYTSLEMAQDYAALLDDLNIDRCHVIGCSMGSIIGQQLAIHFPDKVNKLILMCPWAYCDQRTKSIFEVMVHCKTHFNPAEFSHFIQTLIYSNETWAKPGKVDEFTADQQDALTDDLPQSLQGLKGQAAACIHHSVLEDLAHIPHPTLIIGGKDDAFIPAWMAEEMATTIPNADIHLYPKSGHAFHWENIEDFNPRVAEWLNR